jgi:uncharacterized protein (DUF1697 family)
VTCFVALLRAVNVGGTGKLPMAELKSLCEVAGLANPRTVLASGNVVFESDGPEAAVKAALEASLKAYAGKPVAVLVCKAEEMADVLVRNPFPDAPPEKTVAIFLDEAPPKDAIDKVSGRDGERVALGKREIYVVYGAGIGRSKLKIPAAKTGTARNMNTVSKLAALAAAG